MPIGAGTRLGPYEVVAPIGAGGMGEVYRATDTKLGREVAIKVLPAEVAGDPERLARFEREAKLLASLNHPNIAHVYGFESATLADVSAVHFLAMELVPGEDLGERLKHGKVPVDEALAIAKQIADALEEAHEKGIVHRDLKPANVKLTPDGKVKVLDFGLARAYAVDQASGSGPDLSQSPTLAHTGTAAGLILGTAAYMSPEQARGKAVDKRSDIWAFGVVLWEMLTGQRLFVGETVSDVLAGVLTRDPALDDLPSGTPGAVRRLLRRCLVRDARQRLRDIGEARLALAEPDVATVRDAPLRTRAWPWVAAAVGVGLGLFGLLRTQARSTSTASAPTLRFTLLPQPPGEIEGFPAISPDGQSIAFGLLPASGVPQLWALSLTTGESRLLPDTEHGTDPFWSPDGRFVGYFSRGQLRRLELATGLARALAPASDPRGGAWSENGEIFFTPNSSAGLFRLPADGGTPARITKLDPSGAESHRYPTVLPGGRAIVYASMGDKSEKNGLFWLSLADGRTKRLAAEVSRTHYDPRGYLLWARQGALVAQRLEPGTGELAGEPFRIAEGVGTDAQRYGMTWFGAAAGIVATRVGTSIATQLRWYDRGGRRLADVTAPGIFFEPALSPDGRSVAVSVGVAGSPRGDIWIFDVAGKDRGRRLTFGGVSTPAWTPDGQWVIYSSRDPSGASIVRKRADGSGTEETLHVVPGNAYVDSVSPRAPLLSLEAYDEAGNADVHFLSLEGERKARPFVATPAAEAHGAFSPEGRLLAYTSDESGLPQIYAKEISGAASRWQLTTDGGDQAVWSADGTEIFYVGLDRVLRALPVLGMTPFRFGEPKPLFKLDIPALSITGNRTFYAVSSDRRRFLVNTLVAGESAPGLHVVLNWRAPVGGER